MTNRIDEITQKIYNEGIVKAQEDARQILQDAKTRADEILSKAKSNSKEFVLQAQKQSDEIKRTTEAELKLAAKQFTSKLKQDITNIITTSQIKEPVRKGFEDISFIQNMILTLLSNWSQNRSDDMSLNVLLPKDQEKELSTFFDSRAKEIMDQGVDFSFDPKLDGGFKIEPKDGSYIISFTEKDFENYFMKYLKERTKNLLFGEGQ